MNKMNELTQNDIKLLKEKYSDLESVIEKLESNFPVQYLIGNVSFYGLPINVDSRVLIPRFETETLVEKTINLLKEYDFINSRLLEVGTGSGCISIALKKLLPNIEITAIDISNDSLDVADSNANLNNVEINFLNEDIFKYKVNEKFDVLVSNPPYINKSLIIDPKTKYEPQNAIYADDEGLIFYKYMISNYQKFLNSKFIMAFEIGEEQGDVLIQYAKDCIPNSKVFVEKDLSEKPRYLFIINE